MTLTPYEKSVAHMAALFSLSAPPEFREERRKFFLDWLDEHDEALYRKYCTNRRGTKEEV